MKSCCVPCCPSGSKKAAVRVTKFYEFPSEKNTRAKWLEWIAKQGSNRGENWEPSDRSVICSLHFLPSDFKVNAKGHNRLVKGAVPSIYNYFPTCEDQPRRKIRRKMINKSLESNIVLSAEPIIVHSSEDDPTTTVEVIIDQTSEESMECDVYLDEKEVQTDPVVPKLEDIVQKLKSTRNIQYKKKQKVKCLQKEILVLQGLVKNYKETFAKYHIEDLLEDADCGNLKAAFLLEQLKAYADKKHHWTDEALRCALIFRNKSKMAYEFVAAELLTLPSYSTLRRSVGATDQSVDGEENVILTEECG